MRICFLGESFVNGTGDPAMLGWVGRICAAAARAGHDITCYNLGIRRETTDDLVARWLVEVERRALPDHDPRVVFSFGVNDTTDEFDDGHTRVSPDRSLANARAILIAATARYPTLFVGPPPVGDDDPAQNDRIATLSARFAELAAELNVPYLETCQPLRQSQIWRTETVAGDGAHPGAGGYAEMAKLVSAWSAWQAWLTPR